MTERERVLAVLNHRQPDQLPWLADFAYLVHSLKETDAYPSRYIDTYLDNGLQKMHRDYGTGFYLQGFGPWKSRNHGWDAKWKGMGTPPSLPSPPR